MVSANWDFGSGTWYTYCPLPGQLGGFTEAEHTSQPLPQVIPCLTSYPTISVYKLRVCGQLKKNVGEEITNYVKLLIL